MDGQNVTEFNNRIMTAIEADNIINLHEVTPFDWDKLYYFHPYTPPGRMYEITGARWTNNHTFIGYLFFNDLAKEVLYDELYTLVFINNGKVVCHFTGLKKDFDFDQELKKEIEIKSSLFKVATDGSRYHSSRYPVLVKYESL